MALSSLNTTQQHNAILVHMARAGHITVREANIDHGIASPTKRISELRDLGYQITTRTMRNPATGQRYVRYSLAAGSGVTGRQRAA